MIALPQTLPVNKTYLILMAAFGLLLLGIGLFGATHKAEKYVVAALGVGLCVYATMSMPLSMNHLQLDADGMTIKMAFRPPRRINFADVSPDGFAVVRRNNSDQVMWRYKLGAGPRPVFRILDFLHDALPYQDRLLFNYGGRNTQKMCELLNVVFTQKKHA